MSPKAVLGEGEPQKHLAAQEPDANPRERATEPPGVLHPSGTISSPRGKASSVSLVLSVSRTWEGSVSSHVLGTDVFVA